MKEGEVKEKENEQGRRQANLEEFFKIHQKITQGREARYQSGNQALGEQTPGAIGILSPGVRGTSKIDSAQQTEGKGVVGGKLEGKNRPKGLKDWLAGGGGRPRGLTKGQEGTKEGFFAKEGSNRGSGKTEKESGTLE